MNSSDIDQDICNLEDPDSLMKKKMSNKVNIKIPSIQQLYAKLAVYEEEIKGLINEKISLQEQINNLQIQLCQFTKKKKDKDKEKDKTKKSGNSNNLLTSLDSVRSDTGLDSSKLYIQEASGIKQEINNLNKILEKQRDLINLNNSLLNDSIEIETEFHSKPKSVCDSSVRVLRKEKEEMHEEIANLKKEIYSLMELLKRTEEEKDNSMNEADISNIPPIDYFFKLKNKIILVDIHKDLWHLKKCTEYEEFKKANASKYSSKEECFENFIEYYQNMETNDVDQGEQVVEDINNKNEDGNKSNIQDKQNNEFDDIEVISKTLNIENMDKKVNNDELSLSVSYSDD